ncbi:MAG: HEAT repeat domain-containing protein [Acidobacteria bacterium]|nr:HEAT repeat domain-containing protein [Acidobacteriota bacterium]
MDNQNVTIWLEKLQSSNEEERIDALSELTYEYDERAFDLIGQAISDSSPKVRESAIRAAQEIKNPRFIEPIIQALTDSALHVRYTAAYAFAYLPPDTRALGPLLLALKDPASSVNRGAATSLVAMYTHEPTRDSIIVKHLLEALAHPLPDVRSSAAMALGKICEPSAVEPLIKLLEDRDSTVRYEAAEALGLLGDKRAVEPLIQCLEDSNSWVRSHAASALGKLNDQSAVMPLMHLLVRGDPLNDQPTAAGALGELRDERAVEPLINLFEKADDLYQSTFLSALGKIGGPKATELILKVCSDPDRRIRHRAAFPFFRLQGQTSVEALKKALTDEDFRIRERAAVALRRNADLAIEELLVALNDPEPDVRVAAAVGLDDCYDERIIHPLIERFRTDPNADVRHRAGAALLQEYNGLKWYTDEVLAAFLNAFDDPEKKVRDMAIWAFTHNDELEPQVTERLLQFLEDRNKMTRYGVFRALQHVADSSAIRIVLAHLEKEQDAYIRKTAIDFLAKFNTEAAIGGLISLLDDRAPEVREHAAEIFAHLKSTDERIIPALMRALDDQVPRIHIAAADSLMSLHQHPPLDLVIQAAKSSDFVSRWKALITLGKSKDERVFDVILDALHDEDERICSSAASALGEFGSEKAIEPLLNLAHKNIPRGKFSVVSALREILHPRSVEALQSFLNDDDPVVRSYTEHALDRLKQRLSLDQNVRK